MCNGIMLFYLTVVTQPLIFSYERYDVPHLSGDNYKFQSSKFFFALGL